MLGLNRAIKFCVLMLCLASISACLQADLPETSTEPASAPEPNESDFEYFGQIEIFFDAIGSERQASRSSLLASVSSQVLTNQASGFDLQYVSGGYFDTDGSEVNDPDSDCDYSNGARYLHATYEVRNATYSSSDSGVAYNSDHENITLLAIDSNISTNGHNAVGSIKKFDGSSFLTPESIANCIKPTHRLVYSFSGMSVLSDGADFQAFSEDDIPSATDLGVDEIFPYGFVVRSKTRTADRVLPANPEEDDYAGTVTFAVRLPKEASNTDNPYSFSLIFLMLTDDTKRVTEGLYDQGSSSAETRADTLSDANLTTLGNSSTTASENTLNTICSVRTAGTLSSPGAFLVDGCTPCESFLTDTSSDTYTDDDRELSLSCEAGYADISTNNLPNHDAESLRPAVSITAQTDASYSISLNPSLTGSVYELEYGAMALAVSGVKFAPGAKVYYNNDEDSGWEYDALGANSLGALSLHFDSHNAHVQTNDGEYHYHGVPTGLIESLISSDDDCGSNYGQMLLIGYMADGFPLYYKCAYSDANDSSSALKKLAVSYQLRTGTRPDGPGGTYDGTFIEDYEYDASYGDLDECNGRTGVTPEYPDGSYHYFISDEFPFVPRCFKGTPNDSFIPKALGGTASQ